MEGYRSRMMMVLAAVTLPLVAAPPARAAFQQATCSTDWGINVPVDIGSGESDLDLHTYFTTGNANYGLNELFTYSVEVNSNVEWMNPHLLNWNTEAGYDILTVDGGGSDYQFSGNLGTQWWGTKYGYNGGAQYPIQWVSDYSNTELGGAEWDLLRFQCTTDTQTTIAPIRSLVVNTRHDGVFLNDNDVYYFSVTQPANKRMVVTLDVNAADNTTGPPDFDLYESTSTSMPDDSNFQQRAYDSNFAPDGGIDGAGEILVVQPVATAQTVYLGVHNFRGHGHFSLRANLTDALNHNLKICTQDMTAAQVMADPGWPNVQNTLVRVLLRDLAATNGNLWLPTVTLQLQSSGLQSTWSDSTDYCDSDASCDWCMQAYGLNADGYDGCGFQTAPSGRVRIPNVKCQGAGADPNHAWDRNWGYPLYFSKTLEHENGHGLGRMIKHSDVGVMLDDQYSQSPTEDAHTVMNGPVDYPFAQGSRYSTNYNHCKPWDPQQTDTPICTQPVSDWTMIQNSGWAPDWVYPDQNQSEQPWSRAGDNLVSQARITFTAR